MAQRAASRLRCCRATAQSQSREKPHAQKGNPPVRGRHAPQRQRAPGLKVGGTIYYPAIRPAKPDGSTDDTIEAQARQAFENLRILLAGSGATFEDVVKVQVFVTDSGYIRPMGQVWNEHFPIDTNPTARIVLVVSALPGQNTMLSLDVIAQAPGA